jgi:hypothetical protein
MTLSINASTYTGDTARSPDSYRYLGAANTFSNKDYVDVWRKAPIATSTSDGKGRAFIKMTRTLTDGTDAVGDMILKVEVSVPVGAVTAQAQDVIDDIAAWLATAPADSVLLSQQIVL